jgi:hypothetical protein
MLGTNGGRFIGPSGAAAGSHHPQQQQQTQINRNLWPTTLNGRTFEFQANAGECKFCGKTLLNYNFHYNFLGLRIKKGFL